MFTRNKINFFLIYGLLPFLLLKILTIFFLGLGPGVPFGAIHHPEKDLLQYDLLNTLKYWHYSPPLINFILGILLKITDGSLFLINLIYFLINLSMTFIILLIGYYFCVKFDLSKSKKIILLFFIIFNPDIIFYENYSRPIYSHTIAFLFSLLCYYSFNFFEENRLSDYIKIFIVLCIMTYTWTLFHPILLIAVYFIFYFIFNIKYKKNLIIFLIFFSISLFPFIKNKIVFNFFGAGSHLWIQISQTIPEHKENCFQPIKDIIAEERRNYKIDHDKWDKLHPSLKDPPLDANYEFLHLNLNNLTYVKRSYICKEWFLNKIINDPLLYPEKRVMSFLASHSKFAFEFVVGAPDFLKKTFSYENHKNIKLFKQLILITYMLCVYLLFFYIILFNKNLILKRFLITIMTVYFYLVLIGHFFNGYEQERMMYGGIFIHFLFYLFILNKKKDYEFK